MALSGIPAVARLKQEDLMLEATLACIDFVTNRMELGVCSEVNSVLSWLISIKRGGGSHELKR